MAGNIKIKLSEVTYTMKKFYSQPHVSVHELCSESTRANFSGHTLQQLMDPSQQKQNISEHLYHKIYNMHPVVAGKITGTACCNLIYF